jgi:hypothetical protein
MTAEIRQSYLKHAAIAQLHRWYQGYENRTCPLENQLDILKEDIKKKPIQKIDLRVWCIFSKRSRGSENAMNVKQYFVTYYRFSAQNAV